jgi:apolipoprotein N-acyltransferase
MPTELMPTTPPVTTPPVTESTAQPSAPIEKTKRHGRGEMTAEDIIAAARKAPVLAPGRGALALSLMTAALLWASFMPLDWGFLGWLALVPAIQLVRLPRRTRWMYPALYLGGMLCYTALLQWMRLGDPMMWPAWLALAWYVAVYLPVFVWLSRVAVHRFKMPLTLAVPVVWVGLEYFRSTLMTGFAWYLLSHTQHRFIELIQVSDVTGAYGVSFIVALTSAAIAGLVPARWLAKLKLFPPGYDPAAMERPESGRRRAVAVAVCLTLFAATLAYGFVRRSQAEFVDGPRVALVQGNFPPNVKRNRAEYETMYRTHESLTAMAVSARHPDVVIWPETMYRASLLEATPDVSDEQLRGYLPIPPEVWRQRRVQGALKELSEMAGAALIIGLEAYAADEKGVSRYNSAAFVQPERGVTGRYDKIHRVPFGEYFPLQDVYPALRQLTPYGMGLDRGDAAAVFRVGEYRLTPIICYEDTVPHVVRRVMRATARQAQSGRPADVLVNITNDGWFAGSSETDQHLITSRFRAIECRTPLVRAVNTGISAVVDGDGVVVEPDLFIDGDFEGRKTIRDPETGRFHKSLNAVLVDDVPLDNRRSLYLKTGDWFAGSCAAAVVLLIGSGLWRRRRKSEDALDAIEGRSPTSGGE